MLERQRAGVPVNTVGLAVCRVCAPPGSKPALPSVSPGNLPAGPCCHRAKVEVSADLSSASPASTCHPEYENDPPHLRYPPPRPWLRPQPPGCIGSVAAGHRAGRRATGRGGGAGADRTRRSGAAGGAAGLRAGCAAPRGVLPLRAVFAGVAGVAVRRRAWYPGALHRSAASGALVQRTRRRTGRGKRRGDRGRDGPRGGADNAPGQHRRAPRDPGRPDRRARRGGGVCRSRTLVGAPNRAAAERDRPLRRDHGGDGGAAGRGSRTGYPRQWVWRGGAARGAHAPDDPRRAAGGLHPNRGRLWGVARAGAGRPGRREGRCGAAGRVEEDQGRRDLDTVEPTRASPRAAATARASTRRAGTSISGPRPTATRSAGSPARRGSCATTISTRHRAA